MLTSKRSKSMEQVKDRAQQLLQNKGYYKMKINTKAFGIPIMTAFCL